MEISNYKQLAPCPSSLARLLHPKILKWGEISPEKKMILVTCSLGGRSWNSIIRSIKTKGRTEKVQDTVSVWL